MNSWHIQMVEGWEPGDCSICRADIGIHCTERLKVIRALRVCPLSCATKNLYPINTGKVEGKTQKDRLANVLKDFKPHSTFELVRKVYGVNVATVARLASRVDDLRREGWDIRAQRSKKQPNKWWYMAIPKDLCPEETYMLLQGYDILEIDKADAAAAEYE